MSAAACEACGGATCADPTAFQLHVTVAPDSDPLRFHDACIVLGVRDLAVANTLRSGERRSELLTSSTVRGTDVAGALAELRRIAHGLRTRGLRVVRQKIETAPPPHYVPGTYLECHVLVTPGNWLALSLVLNMHLSLTGQEKHYLTLRSWDSSYGIFKRELDLKVSILEVHQARPQARRTEWALYDSNPELDEEWMR